MSGYCGLAHNRGYGYEYYPHYDFHCHREGKYGHMLTNHVTQIHNSGDHTSFDIPVIRIYDNTGKHFYVAISQVDFLMHQNPDHQRHLTNMTNPGYDQITMSVTNHGRWFKGKWATLVYLHGGSDPGTGYYYIYKFPGGATW